MSVVQAEGYRDKLAMLEGYDILVFTYSDWLASWSTPQQVATRLAPRNRVLYVDVPRPCVYALKKADPQGAGRWEGKRLQEVQPGFFVYHPPHIFLPFTGMPFHGMKFVLNFNGSVLSGIVKKAMAQLEFKPPILWNFSPLHGMAVERTEHIFTIYDICDEWKSYLHSANGCRLVDWIEGRLCRQADLVFVGTDNAKPLRDPFNKEVHVVHHAADYYHFSKAALPDTPIPEDVKEIPRPIIGSVGVIDPARFDVNLILHLSRERPEWSIVLVGPPRKDMDMTPLQGHSNVHLVGNRPISELPAYLKAFDVAIVPYMVNEATRNIYPLKLQEYLATGKPIVSSAMPAVLPYRDTVAIAESHGDFVAKIEQCLGEDGPEMKEARQEVARRNSWEQRVEEKSRHILRILESRPRKKEPKKL